MANMNEYAMRPGLLTRTEENDRRIYVNRLAGSPFHGEAYVAAVNPLALPRDANTIHQLELRRASRMGMQARLYAVDHTDTHGVWAFYSSQGYRYAVAGSREELLRNAEQDGILYPRGTRSYRHRYSSIRMPRRRRQASRPGLYARVGFDPSNW